MAGAAVGKPARCHSFPVPRPTLGTQTSYARYREALCHAINGEGDINVDCTFVLSVTKHKTLPREGTLRESRANDVPRNRGSPMSYGAS